MRTSDRLTAAYLCAHLHLRVFPVWWPVQGACQCPAGASCPSPGKHPRIAGWDAAATIDCAQIARWWGRWPDANIGIACGPSRILALDVDIRHGGDETLRDLIATHGPLPPTVETVTGSGGRHILYTAPAGITNHSPFVGIDVRGQGGFVVAPGSMHVSGHTYEWEAGSHPDDVPIASAPSWLLDLLRRQRVSATPAPPLPERLPVGQRHDWLLSIAGSLRWRGANADELFACLKVFNHSRCAPPLSDVELHTIATSVARYEPAPPIGSAWAPGTTRRFVIQGDAR